MWAYMICNGEVKVSIRLWQWWWEPCGHSCGNPFCHTLPLKVSLNDSLRIRREFGHVWVSPEKIHQSARFILLEIPMKFQRFFWWQNVLAKRLAARKNGNKQHFIELLLVAKKKCHSILPPKNVVEMSSWKHLGTGCKGLSNFIT